MPDWIKVEKSTPRKQEIAEIARALHISTHEAFVRCFLAWSWADTESEDGFVKGADLYIVDSVAGRRGFGDVMVKVGWLLQRDGGVEFPGFEKHMGQSKKKRERQKRWRDKKKDGVGVSVGAPVAPTSISLSSGGGGNYSEAQEGREKAPLGSGAAVTAHAVAAQWCYVLARVKNGYPEDKPDDIAARVSEMLRQGQSPGGLLAAILDPKRDRAEYFWQFKKRLEQAARPAAETIGEKIARLRAKP